MTTLRLRISLTGVALATIFFGLSADLYALPVLPFRFLNTEAATGTFPGQIDGIDDGSTRVTLADVSPTPFGLIGDWKGFASDGLYYYYLNTNGGGGFLGDIDRTDLDGSNRINILDGPTQVQPNIANIGNYQGFAAHGDNFYFLNVTGSETDRGTILQMSMNGGGVTTLADISPAPFGGLTDWRGFATDGSYFYLLNTEAPAGTFGGNVDRINFDGTGRINVGDVAPSPFGNIAVWKGFALAVPTVPEPSSIALGMFGMLSIASFRWRRRHRECLGLR